MGHWKQITKRNGKFRLIYCPDREEKAKCRKALVWLHKAARLICNAEVVHGFFELRSVVTGAERHVNKRFTVSFDIEDFFHHVTLSSWEKDATAIGGKGNESLKFLNKVFFRKLPDSKSEPVAAQGLPSSPVVSNIVFAKVDDEILRLIPSGVVYTRYADDLTFSTNSPDDVPILLALVPEVVKLFGFSVNTGKTHVQDAHGGVRHVTGVGVDENGIRPTRKAKRKLRAARHRLSRKPNRVTLRRKVTGLEEWCKLRKPRAGRRTLDRITARHRGDMPGLIVAVADRENLYG